MPESYQLNTWIAESNSWQSFIDFKLPLESMANYPFYASASDFYLSLMSRGIELLKEFNPDENHSQFLSIAKGLEIFSLETKRNYFHGIDQSNNVLYAASFYFLANYPASAWILASIYNISNYKSEIDRFLHGFLKRKLNTKYQFDDELSNFINSGDLNILDSLINKIKELQEYYFEINVDYYFSFLLSKALLIKFRDNNLWADLLKINNNHDYWRSYITQSISKSIPVWSYFPSQKAALENGILGEETSTMQMPTSSGKTSITELIIYNEFRKNKDCKILYLAPYRALASELKQTLAVNISRLGIKSKTIYGGNIPTLEERESILEVNLLIVTPEKFIAIEDVFPGINKYFTTIICDEGQLLDDSTRGLSYELLLSRIKQDPSQNQRFVFISAIIPNISTLNDWLGGNSNTLISSEYKPTELEYAFLIKMSSRKNEYYLDVNPLKQRPFNYQLYKYLSDNELNFPIPNSKKRIRIKSKAGISVAVSLKATNTGTVALFSPSKGGKTGVEFLVNEAIFQLSVRTDIDLTSYSPPLHLEKLEEYFRVVFGNDYLLTRAALKGILFHHGDLPQGIREIIEESIRMGKIRFVICTNTLAEGVNLPIKCIVIHGTTRYNEFSVNKRETLKIRDLKNLVGRAGRAGRETKGMVIIPHSGDFEIIKKLIREENIEPVYGQLFTIIEAITAVLVRRRLKLSTEILDSLGEEIQLLLDSVDTSMIDLLSEEVEVGDLSTLVDEMISKTLSFFQSNDEQKITLKNLFEIRAEKLIPFINAGEFKSLKGSGTNIRLFDEIKEIVDFSSDLWDIHTQSIEDKWLTFILNETLFKFNKYIIALNKFNRINSVSLDNDMIRKAIESWINGDWYEIISEELNIEINAVLKLINNLIGFEIQNIVSTVIRIKEINSDVALPYYIQNFPLFIQFGINSKVQLNLLQLGLIDRVSILVLGNYLSTIGYGDLELDALRIFLREFREKDLEELRELLPAISYEKTLIFIQKLDLENIY